MSTVSTTINHEITLGTPGYYSPLTVTNTGAVNNNGTSVAIYGYGGTLQNFGTVSATGAGLSGVFFSGDGSVDNDGLITAPDRALYLADYGTVTNTGTIVSSGYNAIDIGGAGTVTNSTGTITAAHFDILIRGAGSVSNGGTIQGDETGILLAGGGGVTNTGLISVPNGIEISGGVGSVVNAGSIYAHGGNGVDLAAGGTVSNQANAVITSIGYSGVYIGGGAGALVNEGTIDGARGVGFGGTAGYTLIDSGTIIGAAGMAVAFGAGDDLMQFQPGTALIAGTVDGGGGTNTLEFAAGTGTLIGQGADFVNFTQGTVDSGGAWSIDGNVTLGTGIDLTISGSVSVAGTLENAGTISPVSYVGLQIAAGGYLRNDASGTIVNNTAHGFFNSTVRAHGGSNVTIVNFGVIEDPAGDASIYLTDGGTVVNGSVTDTSALISGLQGIYAYTGPATVTNFGSITGFSDQGIGLSLIRGGVVTNGAPGSTGALISGSGYGVFMPAGTGTVTNFGTISSARYGIDIANGTVVDAGLIAGGIEAIKFGGAGDLVVLENGFTITGGIVATGSGNVVELLGSAGAPVAATYNALGLSGFQTAAFAPGNGNYATWTITNDAALPGTIAGFTGIHDAIDLTTLSDANNDATTSFDTLTNVLTVTGDNGSVQLQLDSEDYTGNAWTARNDGSNGTEVTPLCFCAGTAIATPLGDVPVERLRVGDLVVAHTGAARPVRWIGTGRVLATRGRRSAATPVIVRKGALGPNVPNRDLHVTKAHSLYLDGVLVPVEFLVNHRTILWDDHAQEVTLYHVELETHDVLVANGALAESYRDDGNRWLFQNGNTGWGLPPKPSCAEVVTGGPIVDAIWRRLLDRAGPSPHRPLTSDPDLHLLVDGCRMDAEWRTGSAFLFTLPAGVRSVRIASRAAAPAELGMARDPRQLGVGLRRIGLYAGSHACVVQAADDRLAEGFHGYEADGDRRWTDGDAALPVELFGDFEGPVELVLHVCGETQYRADGQRERTAA